MVRIRYDDAGRLWKRSVPLVSGASVGDGWESYEYDAMGRSTRLVRPGTPIADVTWDYPDLYTVVETNEVGHQITRVFSADRMPVSASVEVGSATEVTTFGYAPFGNVDWIQDPAGNTTVMEYDALGRRTFLDDPNTGPIHEAYNAFGELREQVDAIGNVRTFVRDGLGRVLTRTTEDGTDTFTYDLGVGNVGRPHTAHSADGVTIEYEHDPIGRPTGRTYIMGFEQFSVAYDYDPYGRPWRTTYPVTASGYQLVTQRSYNPTTGRLAAISDVSNGTSLWQVQERDIAGRVGRASLGAKLTMASTYDPKKEWLKARQVTSEVNGLTLTRLHLSYGYHDNGQVKTRDELASGVGESYAYDARGRLESWDRSYNGLTRTRTYGFDAAGNLDEVWLTGGGLPPKLDDLTYPQPQSPQPHATQSQGVYTYGYDADGRMEWRKKQASFDRTFSYNSHNLPEAGWSNGVTFTIAYDAHGQRFRKDSTIETTYVAGIYERRRDGASVSHRHLVPLEGGAMAVLNLSSSQELTTHYAVTDDTGTPHAILRDDGAVEERLFYAPYGERLDLEGEPMPKAPEAMSYGMTGHEYDDEIGLINMGGRVYDPDLRRFLTPDPFVSGPFDARGLDRYGYVDGDPANKSDPTGFSAEEQTPSADPPGGESPVNYCLGTGCQTGDSLGRGSETGGLNQDPTTGVSAGGEGVSPNVGQGTGGYYIDDGLAPRLQMLEGLQTDAMYLAGGALAVAAVIPAVEAAAAWAAANATQAGILAGGGSGLLNRYGRPLMRFGQRYWRAGAQLAKTGLQKASNVALAVGGRLSGWAQSWGSAARRLAADERGSFSPGRALVRLLGQGSPDRTVKHHIFNVFRGNSPASEKYRVFFRKHNIEIHSWTVRMSDTFHKEWIHGAGRNWTTAWKRWIDANPGATTREVYQQAGKMMDEYGISHLPLETY